MENIPGIIVFIMIIIFTCINLSILHSRYIIVYFSGEARFRHILYAFFLAWVEVGIIVKIFSGVFVVLLTIIKFILKIILILAIIATIGFLLSKILPKIIPKTKPMITKILLFIDGKIHIFDTKPEKTEGENTDTAKEDPIPEEKQSDMSITTDKNMICSKCGKVIKRDSKFCQFCGNKTENNV